MNRKPALLAVTLLLAASWAAGASVADSSLAGSSVAGSSVAVAGPASGISVVYSSGQSYFSASARTCAINAGDAACVGGAGVVVKRTPPSVVSMLTPRR